MKLYEIAEEIRTAIEKISSIAEINGGEIPQETSEILDQLEIARDQKILDTACYIRSLESESVAVATELNRLRDRKKAIDKKVDFYRNYLAYFMQDGEKLKDGRIKISVSFSKAVIILDEEMIPETYKEIKVSVSKSSIKKALDSGEDVPGACIVERKGVRLG